MLFLLTDYNEKKCCTVSNENDSNKQYELLLPTKHYQMQIFAVTKVLLKKMVP